MSACTLPCILYHVCHAFKEYSWLKAYARKYILHPEVHRRMDGTSQLPLTFMACTKSGDLELLSMKRQPIIYDSLKWYEKCAAKALGNGLVLNHASGAFNSSAASNGASGRHESAACMLGISWFHASVRGHGLTPALMDLHPGAVVPGRSKELIADCAGLVPRVLIRFYWLHPRSCADTC